MYKVRICKNGFDEYVVETMIEESPFDFWKIQACVLTLETAREIAKECLLDKVDYFRLTDRLANRREFIEEYTE